MRPAPDFKSVSITTSIDSHTSYLGNGRFCFLNIEHRFDEKVDWDFPDHGKLWTYNLNYFEFINQEHSQNYQSEFSELINDFIQKLPNLSNANEPFPTSLRIINWIKYFVKNKISDVKWNASLYSQSYILKDNVEYHLLGNHLLENGFALAIAGIYFQDANIYQQGKKILEAELNEQILDDGAHFELSPMYHCLMLYRLLDTINIIKSNVDMVNGFSANQESFLDFLMSKGAAMAGWIKAMSYDDGTYPHFNDSTDGIAPTVSQLLSYARSIGIAIQHCSLSDSGFRRLKNENFDIVFKTGKIGPDYIPGHAHADSLNFLCNINDQPFIVDVGISTYEKNVTRQKERCTGSHNTVTLNGEDSSKVWGGFRVGIRANSRILGESIDKVYASHDGYKKMVFRTIYLEKKKFIIEDSIGNKEGLAHFHFESKVSIQNKGNNFLICNGATLHFENAKHIQLESYQLSKGFNYTISATKAIVQFENKLITTITNL